MEGHASKTGQDPTSAEDTLKQQQETKACQAFRDYVEKMPELQAIFRHFLTLPSVTQRAKLLGLLKSKAQRMMSYDSEFFPMEPIWYMENILSKQRPTLSELWWHQNGLVNSNWAIYSYIDERTGLLARRHISLLVNPDSPGFVDEFELAVNYKDTIFELGGMCSVSIEAPDLRHYAINVVIGIPNKKWTLYYVKLYSPLLFVEVLEKRKFDPTSISKFVIPSPPPVRINIESLSKLA